MRICKFKWIRVRFKTNNFSDGTTPQQQTEQILALTPILRGQKSNEKNPIPPHRRSESFTPSITQKTSEPHQPQAPEPDLIDFGQNESPQVSPSQPKMEIPADLKAAQTQNNGQQQKDLESTLISTSTTEGSQGPLIDFHNEMKKDLPILQVESENHTLKRQDTDTQSLDEFMDAEG